ncbi:helix-turn-helix domain-containing protein [Thermobifida halotolerans]|uniref:Helix-turn-helix domain-containing protein n=1 Tax=Thermobifida halotolerans TaxID=483545 RepID=A0AA97M1W1_9ACTN|nr:helix-turn-helix transcriptional regulator [Thermobifida halotolerans]UOE17813.1 helix-turn-helix domain-containing protein [Thermobifida halotolerans]
MGTDEGSVPQAGLGEFLSARRSRLLPEDIGLLTSGRRRVPGLRREEVALLAGVSTDYYMRLEQGRERHPSPQVVEALARALHLDEEATEHLRRLAHTGGRRSRRVRRTRRVDPHLCRLLERWSEAAAFVLDGALDVLARNRLAKALHSDFSFDDNLARMVFLDPVAHRFYRNWERTASATVAELHRAAGLDSDDPRLNEIVGELSLKSTDFRSLWARHDVRGKTGAAKPLHHSSVGDLDLRYDSFTVNGAPGQQLIVYHAEPGTSSEESLALLGSLHADSAGIVNRPERDRSD